MSDLTCWKVFKVESRTGVVKNVLVALDTGKQSALVEEVTSNTDGCINGHKLYGKNNDHFVGFAEVWNLYLTQNDISKVTDISLQFE